MGVGQKLQDERLRQGLSLEEIEEETKIRKYYLEALEQENYDVLPPRFMRLDLLENTLRYLV